MAAAAPLLAIPPELRNAICELCIVEDHPLDIANGRLENGVPAICRVNDQLRADALQMWCQRNTFTVHLTGRDSELTAVRSWLDLIFGCGSVRRFITNFCIRRDLGSRAPGFVEVQLDVAKLKNGEKGWEVRIEQHESTAEEEKKKRRKMIWEVKMLATGFQRGGDLGKGIGDIVERMNRRD